MTTLQNLERQHKDIYETIHEAMTLIEQGNLEDNGLVIARHISALAGKLKIHLNSEDKYLYPSLLKKGNDPLKKKTERYMDEMGNLSETYMQLKTSYNTKSKILLDQDTFKAASSQVFDAVLKRMHKEDTDLYEEAKSFL